MPWALLAAAALGMFAASSSGTSRAPFLLDMSRDLATSLPLVANLVARRYVKGYIAHRSRVLVLSKVEAFPPLDSVALGESL